MRTCTAIRIATCWLAMTAATVRIAIADVQNGSFESPTVGSGWNLVTPTSWNVTVANSSTTRTWIGRDITAYGPVPDGHQFVQLAGITDAAVDHLWQNTGILVQPGFTYTLTAAATKLVVSDPSKAVTVSFRLADDSSSDGNGDVVAVASTNSYQSFTAMTATYSPQPGDVGKYLVVQLGTTCVGADINFDNVAVAATYFADLNGSFELPASGTGWTQAIPVSWNAIVANANTTKTWIGRDVATYGAIPHGRQFVQLSNVTDAAVDHLWQNTRVPVQAGATYTLSACVTKGVVNDPSKVTWASLRLASDVSSDGAGSAVAYASTNSYNAFTPLSATYAASTNDVGKYLVINLGTTCQGADVNFDYVAVSPSYSSNHPVSHGRQVILNRGLQIIGLTYCGVSLNNSFEVMRQSSAGWWQVCPMSWNVTATNTDLTRPFLGREVTTVGPIPDGIQIFQLCNVRDPATDHVWQNTGVQVQAGGVYVLTARATTCDVNDPAKVAWVSLKLAANNSSDGTGSPVAYASTNSYLSFTPISATYTAPADDAGKYLVIGLGGTCVAGSPTFDTVNVSSSNACTLPNVSQWQSANFVGINCAACEGVAATLPQLPSGTSWARIWAPDAPYYLADEEMPFVSCLASLCYGDEPEDLFSNPAKIPDMYVRFRDWNTFYPNTLAHSNFYGGQYSPDCPAQLRRFMQTAHPDMLLFDWYRPYYANRDNWYMALQMYRTIAMAGYDGTGLQPIPYGQYIRSYRESYSESLPDESLIRLQAFASWTCGYTFVEWFFYNDSGSGNKLCAAMFVGPGDTAQTSVFPAIATANLQSRNLGPALIRLKSTDFRLRPRKVNGTLQPLTPYGYMPGISIPDWSSTAGGCSYITAITPRGANNTSNPSNYCDWLIGYFQPLKTDNSDYPYANGLHFMICNGADSGTASASAQWVRIEFNFTGTSFNKLQRLSRTTGQTEIVNLTALGSNRYRLDLKLDGGTGDLFRFYPQ